MSNRANNAVKVRRLWIVIFCWFLPALAALINAAILRRNERPPLVVTVPVRPTIQHTYPTKNSGPMHDVKMEGTAEFVTEHRGTLRVKVEDRLIGIDVPHTIAVFHDGVSQEVFSTDDDLSIPVPEGRHDYRVTATTNLTTGTPPSACVLTVRVMYSNNGLDWRVLDYVGWAFFFVGVVQLARLRGR